MQADEARMEASAVEPHAYFRAAKGDHDAQEEMAHLLLAQGLSGDLPITGGSTRTATGSY